MSHPAGGYSTPQMQSGPIDSQGRPWSPNGQQQQAPVPQQFQGQPQQQQQAPQPQQGSAGLDMNARLSGPNIPQELQGKTVGDAMRYYGVMRQDFINRNYNPNQQQPQQQVPQQQQGSGFTQPAQVQQQMQQQPQRAPNGQFQAPQPGQPQQFDQASVENFARQAVQSALLPVQQVSIGTVYEQVSRRFADWGRFDADVKAALQGSPTELLLNPEAWVAAYYHAKGKAASQQQQPQNQTQQDLPPDFWGDRQPQQLQQPVQQQPQYNPQQPQQYQTQQQPQPQQQTPYFVEGPTPSAPQGPQSQSQAGVAGPADEVMARRFGVPVDEYRMWKGGNIPNPAQPQPQTQFQQWNPAAPAGYQPPHQNNGWGR